MAAKTFLQVIKALIDAVPGMKPVYLDHRPEDVEQLGDVVVHLGEAPTSFGNHACGRAPLMVEDRFEVLIHRAGHDPATGHTGLEMAEAQAEALMNAVNAAADEDLHIEGTDNVLVLFREVYQAGGTGRQRQDGEEVFRARVAYVAQYRPKR